MLCDVHRISLQRTVQPFVEQQVGISGQRLPRGEATRRYAEVGRFLVIVNVEASLTLSCLAVLPEQSFQFLDQIGLRSEVAEMLITSRLFLGHPGDHRRTIMTVIAVPRDDSGVEVLSTENMLKGMRDRRGSGARRPSDGNDGVFDRHPKGSVILLVGESTISVNRAGTACVSRTAEN